MHTLNEKGFSTIEVLFLIVITSILLALGISIVFFVTKKEEEKNFKEQANLLISAAQNAYETYKKQEKNDYIVTGDDGVTKGMCITLNGLNKNKFYSKELTDWDGYIVIEEKDNFLTYSLWLTNKKLVIDGYASTQLDTISSKNKKISTYNQESFQTHVKTSFSGTTYEKGGSGTKDGKVKNYMAACINEKID